MRHRKIRKWDTTDDDPTSGLINLFDIWMVFAVALLLAFVQLGALREGARTAGAAQDSPTQDALPSESFKVSTMQLTREKLTGSGQRLGTAYRLQSGQIVYVPDPTTPGPAKR